MKYQTKIHFETRLRYTRKKWTFTEEGWCMYGSDLGWTRFVAGSWNDVAVKVLKGGQTLCLWTYSTVLMYVIPVTVQGRDRFRLVNISSSLRFLSGFSECELGVGEVSGKE